MSNMCLSDSFHMFFRTWIREGHSNFGLGDGQLEDVWRVPSTGSNTAFHFPKSIIYPISETMEEGSWKIEPLEEEVEMAGWKRTKNCQDSSILSFRERFFPKQNCVAQYFPNNVLYNIFSHFSHREIINISHVCRHWYVCSRDKITWRSFKFDGFKVRTLPEALKLLHSIFSMRISPYQKTIFLPIQNLRVPIRHLIFGTNKEFWFLTPDNIIKLTSVSPFLESLKLPSVTRNTNSIDDNMLRIVTSNLRELKKLDISTHKLVTNLGLQVISNCRPSLTHLKFDYCHQITSDGLMNLLRTCPRLQSVSCLFCTDCQLSPQNIVGMSKLCSRLSRMEIDVKPELDNLEKFFFESNNFTYLHLRGWYVKYSYQFSNSIRYLRKLRKLKVQFHPRTILDGCRIESPSLRSIILQRAQLLKRVEVFRCPSLEEFVVEKNGMLDNLRFSGCHRLRVLKFRGSRITSSSLNKYIDQFPQLQEFEIFDCSGLQHFRTESQQLRHLKILICRDLRHLSIVRTPRLQKLRVDLCLNLGSMEVLAPNLREFKLFNTPHQQLPSFSELNLYSEKLGSLNFPRCVHLSRLQIKCGGLKALNLSDCKSLSLQNLNVFAPNLVQFGLSLPTRSLDFNPAYVTNIFAPRHRNLRMLSLSNFGGMNDATLETICRFYQHSLQAISLTNVRGISIPRIGGKEIVGVEFNNCPQLTQPLFMCPKLRKLFFRQCSSLSDLTICCLTSQSVPSLLNLELRLCSRLRNPRIVLPLLKTVLFEKCQNLLQPYLQCPSLKECVFQDCCSLTVPQYSTQEKQMYKLVFQNCERANDMILKTVNANARGLQNIYLHQCNSLVRPMVGRLAGLTNLTFSSCRNLVRPAIQDCPSLKDLRFKVCPSLRGERIEDFVFGLYGNLNILEMTGCPKINSFSIGKGVNNVNSMNGNKNLPLAVSNFMVGDCNLLKFLDISMPSGSEVRVWNCLNLGKIQVSMGLGNEQAPLGRLMLMNNRNLEYVNVRGITETVLNSCVAINDDGICRMLGGDVQCGKGGSLTSLTMIGCNRIVSPTLAHPRIRLLRIFDCKRMNQMRANLPNLGCLQLRGRNFNQNFVNNLPMFLEEKTRNNVREVVLNGVKIK